MITRIEISNFEEREYNLIPFGIEGVLIIEEKEVFLQTSLDDFFYREKENSFIFISDEGRILNFSEEQKHVIEDILQQENIRSISDNEIIEIETEETTEEVYE